MLNNTSKNGIKATLIIYFVLIILLSVCTFVIPFPRTNNGSLVAAYIGAVMMIIAEGSLALTVLFKEEELDKRILDLPIIYSGYIILIIQLMATIIFYICNAYMNLPTWIVIVTECFLFGAFVIQVVKGFFFKNRIIEYRDNIVNTKFMDEFRARLKAIVAINENMEASKDLQDLLEIANGSDPITNDRTIDSENELLSDLQELDEAVKSGSEESIKIVINKTKNTLLERNALCKVGK